jgi:peptidyl-Lys metalloendopeptidase
MNRKTLGDIGGLSFTNRCKNGAGGFLEQFSKRSVMQSLLLAVWLLSAGVQAQTNSLRSELKVIGPDSLQVSYTLLNESKQDVQVLTWNTPLEGAFNSDYFNVSFDGKKELVSVPYRERHMKRAEAKAEDYILLLAGDSISIDLDISHGYLTERVGYYEIQFDGLIEYFAIPFGVNAYEYQFDSADRIQRSLQSNKVVGYQSLSFDAIEAKLPPTFSSCDAGQQSQIDAALTAAEVMATEAAEALNNTTVGQRATAERYTTWFGSFLSSRYTSVSTHFNAIQDATANKTLQFSCGSPRCGRTTFAFVYGNSPYEVYLCPEFWRAELTGTNSRAGTIIHELSHFTILGGTDDHQYGQSAAKQLGATDPNKAINNADSHEYFAENTPALSMSGGTTAPGVPEPNPVNEMLVLGSPITGNLAAGQWAYYEVSGASNISLFNLSADLDLYVGNGARPTTSNYQCRPFAGGSATETCTVDASKTTFIGLQGQAASFSLVANAAPVSSGTSSGSSGDGSSQALSLDTPVTASVDENGWSYFQVTGAAEISLFNLTADLDLYIGDGANPTLASHVCRPFSSGTTTETCPITNPSGTTFIGVNAYSASGSFSLIAREQSSSQAITSNAQTLSLGMTTSGTLDAGQWDYYEVSGATSIKLFDLSADLDLYVSRTATPTAEQFVCRPYSSGPTEESCILDPEGTSYIGVKAYGTGSYSLLATTGSGSVGGTTALTVGQAVTGSVSSQEWVYYEVTGANSIKLFDLTADLDLYVSRTATPTSVQYVCRPFTGGSVEEICILDPEGTSYIGIRAVGGGNYSLLATGEPVSAGANTALTIGQAVTGSVSSQEWVYYEVTGANSIKLYDLSADLDLYVSRTATPTAEQFVCRPYLSDSTEEICILDPEGTSYIGVRAVGDGGNYSLLATGEPVSGVGNQTGNTVLTIGQAVTGSVSSGQWAYYEVANATEISLYGLTADLDLYVSTSGQPTESNYTCRPYIPGDNLETCSITARGTINIGVKGFDSGSYSLVANNSAAMSIGEAVVMEVNQEVLVAGDPLVVTMTVTGDQNLDTYAALILPSGDLFTFSPQGEVKSAGEGVIAFHNSLQVNGEQTHIILNTTLPSGLPSGVWQACGLLVQSGLPFTEENWLGLNCVSYMVNPSSGKVAANTSKTKSQRTKKSK